MRILITGISGFVARHFVEYLSALPEPVHIAGIYHNHLPGFSEDQFPGVKCSFHKIDLLDNGKMSDLLGSFNPEFVLHLASRSSVANSWVNPAETIKHNTGIFLALIDAVRQLNLKCRVLSVGSAEEYGNVQENQLPLVETICPNPFSPYGISRVMQQKLVEIYSRSYGLDIMHTRSFNHIGPYQRPSFVVSSFAKQIADQIKTGSNKIEIRAGNIEVTRDFTDVRDVVKAYYHLLLKGKKGNTYNVCSGKGILLKELAGMFSDITGAEISWNIDPAIFRPSENQKQIGSFTKINQETGWIPVVPIQQSLSDMLDYWKLN